MHVTINETEALMKYITEVWKDKVKWGNHIVFKIIKVEKILQGNVYILYLNPIYLIMKDYMS